MEGSGVDVAMTISPAPPSPTVETSITTIIVNDYDRPHGDYTTTMTTTPARLEQDETMKKQLWQL